MSFLKVNTKILFTQKQVEQKVQIIAQSVNQQFKGQQLVVIGVLKGAFVFCADLLRALTIPVLCDFCKVSAYGLRDKPLQKLHLAQDISVNIKGLDVLLVEDIVDRGVTMQFLKSHFAKYQPRSLAIASLVAKPQSIHPPCVLDYVGFHVKSSVFVVGYGLDYKEQFRELPYLAQIVP